MLSFHNDPAIKEKYVARLAQHHALDQIVQGTGYDDETNRGCAVGCTLDKYDHEAYETELGLPVWLAHLEDAIFEGLPASEAPAFAKEFLECIPVGVDVSDVHWKLSILRLNKLLDGLSKNKESYARECEAAIKKVIKFCTDSLNKVFGTDAEAVEAARIFHSSERRGRRFFGKLLGLWLSFHKLAHFAQVGCVRLKGFTLHCLPFQRLAVSLDFATFVLGFAQAIGRIIRQLRFSFLLHRHIPKLLAATSPIVHCARFKLALIFARCFSG